jgi:hypothetical protein
MSCRSHKSPVHPNPPRMASAGSSACRMMKNLCGSWIYLTKFKSHAGIPNSNDHSPIIAERIKKGKNTPNANIAMLPNLAASHIQ